MINTSDLQKDLSKAVNYYSERLQELRTGRAKTEMFSSLMVNAYDMENQMKAVANVDLDGLSSVIITPYDPSVQDNIIKAIEQANMGYAPKKEGNRIRIDIPALTEETRKQIVKQMYLIQEEVKVTVRQIRHKYMEQVDVADGVSEDEQKRDRAAIQKQIDDTNAKLEEMSVLKEKDIMTV